jgi:energy-coupling factor transport system permease protein
MDLRAFGIGPRTWLLELRYRAHDYALIGLSLLGVAAVIALRLAVG